MLKLAAPFDAPKAVKDEIRKLQQRREEQERRNQRRLLKKQEWQAEQQREIDTPGSEIVRHSEMIGPAATPNMLASKDSAIGEKIARLEARRAATHAELAALDAELAALAGELAGGKAGPFRAPTEQPCVVATHPETPTPTAVPPNTPRLSRPLHIQGIELWTWQHEALLAWQRRNYKGVVEAVTGAGKTRVGLAAAASCLHQGVPTAVIVPTIDLQHQWVKEIQKHISRARVGRLGDGGSDSLWSCDILVAVAASACNNLRPRGGPALLVADECHRYGCDAWQRVLHPRFSHRIGLTATFERADDGVQQYLAPYFGGKCYSLNYARALNDEVIAHFKIAFIGVSFTPQEQMEYDRCDAVLRRTRKVLTTKLGLKEESFGAFIKQVSKLAKSELPGHMPARQFLKAWTIRRGVLAGAKGKMLRISVLRGAIQAANKSIVFTQTKDAAVSAVAILRKVGVEGAMLHSGLDRRQRAQVLAEFEDGDADILAAPKLLDEGVDVPDADLALIVASSQSRLQMVQRMGRVLRKKPDGRLARIAIFYVKNTSEDPRRGAHESFLDLITPVADSRRDFGPLDAEEAISQYLNDWKPSPSG